MPQDPFLIDQIDIEPGSVGTRRINRDAGTGSLAFTDAVITTPVLLRQLAGLRTIANVSIVGKIGAGAQYITIQDAIDAIPGNASGTNPYIVIIMPGRYDETINITKDGVRLYGIGNPEIRSALEATPNAAGNDHTIIISEQGGTTPLTTLIQGCVISNAHNNKACVRVVALGAASMVGAHGISIKDCNLKANAAGGNYTVWATAVNRIILHGGHWAEENNRGLLLVQEVSYLDMQGISGLGAVSLRYDTANNQPSLGADSYKITNCVAVGSDTVLAPAFACDLDGAGVVSLSFCTLEGAQANFSGDQTVNFENSRVNILNLLETTTFNAWHSLVAALKAPNANAVFDTSSLTGTAAFAAVAFQDVVFDVPQSNIAFHVALELSSRPANDETPWISNKAVTGFRINFQTAQTLTVSWRSTRKI